MEEYLFMDGERFAEHVNRTLKVIKDCYVWENGTAIEFLMKLNLPLSYQWNMKMDELIVNIEKNMKGQSKYIWTWRTQEVVHQTKDISIWKPAFFLLKTFLGYSAALPQKI